MVLHNIVSRILLKKCINENDVLMKLKLLFEIHWPELNAKYNYRVTKRETRKTPSYVILTRRQLSQ
jgi:hypothetical protein